VLYYDQKNTTEIKNGCKYSWAVELAYILKLKRTKIGIFLCQQT